MIKILGNSTERVKIEDLNDIIYYRQVKEYSDQEYEKSKDLKREIKSGHLVKIGALKASKGSVETQENGSLVNIKDLKIALREILPGIKGNGISEKSLTAAMREIAPLIVEMVRQEVSRIPAVAGMQKPAIVSPFKGPEYIPDVSTEGMKESLKLKERKVAADDVANNLAALRKLKKS